MKPIIRSAVLAAISTFPLALPAYAQVGSDDVRCYQLKDPLSLAGLADIASELGLDDGCKLGKARHYCEPADATVSAADKKTGTPVVNRPDVTGPDGGRSICYKVSCPAPDVPLEATVFSDMLATRTLAKMKTSMLCVPASPGDYRPTTVVHYLLEVGAGSGSPALPAVQFDGGGALGAIRVPGRHMPDYPGAGRIAFGNAIFTGGTVDGSTDAWAAWHAAAIVVGDYCDTHSQEECEVAWDASDVGRPATLSAVTGGGVVLATWTLEDAWPAGMTPSPPDAGGAGGGILRLSLAGSVQQFAFGSDASVTGLFDDVAPPPAVAPIASDGDAGMDTFLMRYHSPDEALLRLNGLDLAASGDPPSPPRSAVPAYATAQGSFVIEIDGAVAGKFREITGLESEIDIIEYKDGDDPITHKRAGKAKYKNIVLKRGFVNDSSLLEWYKTVLAGATDRKSGSIIYLDREGNEVLRFSMTEAFPMRWKAPELNSHSDTHVVEEIEFVVEKVERN